MTVAGGPLHEQVLTAASALDATHVGIFAAGYTVLRLIVVGGTGVASGAVQLEGAHSPAYAGTWVAIGSALTVVADSVVTALGVNSAYPYVRARISTVLAGGTCTVIITGN